jgi:hypothetical protein
LLRHIGQERGGASASGLNIGYDGIYFGLRAAVNKNMEAARSGVMA